MCWSCPSPACRCEYLRQELWNTGKRKDKKNYANIKTQDYTGNCPSSGTGNINSARHFTPVRVSLSHKKDPHAKCMHLFQDTKDKTCYWWEEGRCLIVDISAESNITHKLLLSGRARPQPVWIPEATALAPWHAEHPMETPKGWEKPYSNVLTTDTDWSDHIFYFVYLLTFYLFLSFMPLPFILKMFLVLVCIFVNGHSLVSEVLISEPVLWQL